MPDAVTYAVRRSGATEGDVGDQRVVDRQVLDRGAVGLITVTPPSFSVPDTDVALTIDGQRVQQLQAGQPGQQLAVGRQQSPADGHPRFRHVPRYTRPV